MPEMFNVDLQPPPPVGAPVSFADQTDRRTYVFSDEIVFRVNVALATYRPLLIFGPPGVGKSSLARDVSRELGWRYYEEVITSRTEAQDLLWRIDLVKRLADSQVQGGLGRDIEYVVPGVLWWAFDPARAKRVAQNARVGSRHAAQQQGQRAVVLIDEIDKADPDIPNNLLVPLGRLTFDGPQGVISASRERAPLVFITSNNERDLPPAFVRRCVLLNIDAPKPPHLQRVATAHFGEDTGSLYAEAETLFTEVASGVKERQLGTAEYLDFVRACLDLDIVPGTADWKRLGAAVLEKRAEPTGKGSGPTDARPST